MMVFRAADGTEFKDRAEYRKYVFLTQYTFKDRQGEVLMKLPGEIDGQPFDLTALRKCEVKLLDHSEAIHADELTDCRVFIAACADSVFVRNCAGCNFTVACKQLRTRDSVDCEFRLYCKTEPIIETSTGITFAPFNGAYAGHSNHLQAAGLTTPNLWFGVYDFNDEAKTGKNWRVMLPPEDESQPWRPLDDASEVAIPRTWPGSIPLPSKQTGSGFSGGSFEGGIFGGRDGPAVGDGNQGSTMAFSFSTSAPEAAALMKVKKNDDSHSSPLCTAVTEGKRRQEDLRLPSNDAPTEAPAVPCGKEAKVGWDPSRFLGRKTPLPIPPSPSSNAPVPPPFPPTSLCRPKQSKSDCHDDGRGQAREDKSPRVQLFGECCSQSLSPSSLAPSSPSKGLPEEEEGSHRLDTRNTDESGRNEVIPLLVVPPLPPLPLPSTETAEEETDASAGRTSFVWDSAARAVAHTSRVSTLREVQDSFTLDHDITGVVPATEGDKIGWNEDAARAAAAASARIRGGEGVTAEAEAAPSPLRRAAIPIERGWRSGESSTGEEAVVRGDMERGSGQSVRGAREEVPLQLRAVLLYASTQRGIDLAKWFRLSRGRGNDSDGGGKHPSGGSSSGIDDKGDEEARPAPLTTVQFKLLLMGLMEGLKAGLTNEEREEIDAAVAPGIIEAAAEAAVETNDVSSEAASSGNARRSAGVDVHKLLDLCGIAPITAAEARTRGDAMEGGKAGGGSEGVERVDEDAREREEGFQSKEAEEDEGKGGELGMVAEDEHDLRVVAQHADLFKGLLSSLGLRKPVGITNSSVSAAAWEASLKTGTVSLVAFQGALKEVGLPLSRARVEALADYICGPQIASIRNHPQHKRRPRQARHPHTNADNNNDHHAFSGGYDGAMTNDKTRNVLFLPAWGLLNYLLKLRVEPKSVEARGKRWRRVDNRDVGTVGGDGSGSKSGDRCSNSKSSSRRSEMAEARPIDFEAWSWRQHEERLAREKEKEREFQKALRSQAHSLGPQELDDHVRRFDIMPPEVLTRELQAMGRAFVETVEGRRRVRELVRRWDKELKESEKTSASVSRGLFLTYSRRGRRRGQSLLSWLEDRHAAMRKARELEAGRKRAQALSRADARGRQALITDVKEELKRLVGYTKKPQKVEKAPGMQVLRSSRDGLDLNRLLKRLEKVAREEREKTATCSSGKQRRGVPTTSAEEKDEQVLLSKEAFMAEFGDVLFSLMADATAASRAKQLAGESLVTPELRRRWAKEAWGPGRDDIPARPGTLMPASDKEKPANVEDDGDGKKGSDGVGKGDGELFTVMEELLLGRGQKEVEHKREMALRTYREWCKKKGKEARRTKRQHRQAQKERVERERRKKEAGLRAYRRWARLAGGGKYFSFQSNSVVSRAGLSSRLGTSSEAAENKEGDCKRAVPDAKDSHCRGPWNSSTDGAGLLLANGSLSSSDLLKVL